MSNLSWFTGEKGIQRLMDIGMSEWIYHLRFTQVHWEDPEDILFTNILRNQFVRGAQHASRAL